MKLLGPQPGHSKTGDDQEGACAMYENESAQMRKKPNTIVLVLSPRSRVATILTSYAIVSIEPVCSAVAAVIALWPFQLAYDLQL